jgi:hypothetical protein
MTITNYHDKTLTTTKTLTRIPNGMSGQFQKEAGQLLFINQKMILPPCGVPG